MICKNIFKMQLPNYGISKNSQESLISYIRISYDPNRVLILLNIIEWSKKKDS